MRTASHSSRIYGVLFFFYFNVRFRRNENSKASEFVSGSSGRSMAIKSVTFMQNNFVVGFGTVRMRNRTTLTKAVDRVGDEVNKM